MDAPQTIDLECDELIPIGELVKERLPGKRLSPATIWRWRLKGVRGVRLESVLVGGCWCTTRAAFAEFLRAQTAVANAAHKQGTGRSEDTARDLEAAGLVAPS